MCGIFGFTGAPDHELLGRMAAMLVHRGPNDASSIELPLVSLGDRRLAIIDAGDPHEPFSNEDGTVWLVYNGEIYNYRELRTELIALGHTFRTEVDTEVVVHAYEEWGPACAARFNGMWAYAIADLRAGSPKLVLTRDHFGIKPLYYAWTGPRLLFGSEIKALLQCEGLSARPDDQSIYEYLVHGLHEHRTETFFDGIRRLLPATYVEIPLGAGTAGEAGAASAGAAGTAGGGQAGAGEAGSAAAAQPLPAVAYWVPELRRDGNADPAELRRLFKLAVERRLISDVPVGSCLSGGLDSTAIVAFTSELLQAEAPDAASLRGRLKTFSAVFDGDPIDERAFIEIAVAATGADTTYIKPSSQEFVDELRDFLWYQEEPTVSTGPYAQWCVMREARTQVTVLLDGQGGDELLAGYVPYQIVYLRQLMREGKRSEAVREAWAARDVLWPFLRRRLGQRRRRLDVHAMLRSAFRRASYDPGYGRSQDDLKERLVQDLMTYSLPCLLRYEDRNATAHSIESRPPYLDQELVEHILRLPPAAIVHDGWSRWILREGLREQLPQKIRERRWKVGFTTPEMRWLKARRAAFISLLQSPTFAARPYWDGPAVARAFLAACRGELEDSAFFWRAINVELWLREFCDQSIVNHDVDVDQALIAPYPAGALHVDQSLAAFAGGAYDRPDGEHLELDARPSVAYPLGTKRRGGVAVLGDRATPALAGDAEQAERLLAAYTPNANKHLFACADGHVWARLPIRTGLVKRGDDLVEVFREFVAAHVKAGDVIVMAEKPVAASQGRSYPLDEIKVTPLARALSKAVTRTPHGIGLGIPETMQLALDEAGSPRILAASAAAAAGKVLRRKGWFYKIAGPTVEAIDGPTWNTLPPHNEQAKLGPKDPDGVAARLAEFLSSGKEHAVGAAIIDASDLTANVLGASAGVSRDLVETLMRDNPLGQGHEQTPVCVLRDLGSLRG